MRYGWKALLPGLSPPSIRDGLALQDTWMKVRPRVKAIGTFNEHEEAGLVLKADPGPPSATRGEPSAVPTEQSRHRSRWRTREEEDIEQQFASRG